MGYSHQNRNGKGLMVEFSHQSKMQLVVRASATASAHVEHVLEVCCYIGWRGATTASSVLLLLIVSGVVTMHPQNVQSGKTSCGFPRCHTQNVVNTTAWRTVWVCLSSRVSDGRKQASLSPHGATTLATRNLVMRTCIATSTPARGGCWKQVA